MNLLIASLNPVLTVVEKAWSDLLPRPQYVQANRDALLRMTTIERYKAHALALGNKPWKGVDDVRVLEELAPLGGEYANPAVSPDPAVQAPTENP